jgi:hypothetical protein
MYETLITKVRTTLEAVTNVKEVFSVPTSKINKYPAVFFKPTGFQNSFQTQNENMAVYRFLAVVIVGARQNGLDNAFGTILPHTVDAIIDKFNTDWNQGTIDGHRVTVKIDTADEWQVSEGQDGDEVYAPLNIEFRLLTSN